MIRRPCAPRRLRRCLSLSLALPYLSHSPLLCSPSRLLLSLPSLFAPRQLSVCHCPAATATAGLHLPLRLRLPLKGTPALFCILSPSPSPSPPQPPPLSAFALVSVRLHTTDDDENQEFYARKTKIGAILNKVGNIFAGVVTIVVVAILEGLPNYEGPRCLSSFADVMESTSPHHQKPL